MAANGGKSEDPVRLSAICRKIISSDTGILIVSALFVVAVHTATNGRYGFHRDELATIDDARFLSWGYVVYPPVTPFMARVALTLFGPSLIGLRFFAALAVGIATVLTGLIAREMGGNRWAQLVAAWAAAISGPVMADGTMFEYVSFDYLWWVSAAYVIVRLLKTEDQHWWLALGCVVGLGLMTKYTMAFFLAGILGAILLINARILLNKWLWFGVAIVFLIVLPNLIWQVQHHFISFDFLKFIHARDVGRGRANGFLLAQFWSNTNIVTVPIWLAGLYSLFFTPEGKRYRMLGLMYLITLAIFFFAKGRFYYVAPSYPMLLAAGAVWGERWLESLTPSAARSIRRAVWTSFAIAGICVAALVLPLAPAGSGWWKFANAVNDNFNEEFGWREMADEVVRVRDSLPPETAPIGVLAGDAGQAGAINLYGRGRGLPEAISGSNTHWLRGYGDPPPKTVITTGLRRSELETVFESCELAGHVVIPFGIENSAIEDRTDIFVCQQPREPWNVFWWRIHWYG